MKNIFEFNKQRSIDGNIEGAFYFVKRHFKPMFRILWKYNSSIIIFFLMSYFLYFYKYFGFFNMFGAGKANQFNDNDLIYLFAVGGLMLISSILFFPRFYASIFGYVRAYDENNGIVEDEKVHHYIKTKFWGFLGVSILGGILITIGFLIFIIPGIYFIVPVSIAYGVYFFEDLGPAESISKSLNYVKGNWWASMMTLFLMGIIVALIGAVFNAPVQIYILIKGILIEKEMNAALQTGDIVVSFMSVVAVIAQYMLKTLSMLSIVLIYFNLREKMTKEGALHKIDQIGKTNE